MLQSVPWIVKSEKVKNERRQSKKVHRQMNVQASGLNFLWTWVTISYRKVSVSADTETKYSAEYRYVLSRYVSVSISVSVNCGFWSITSHNAWHTRYRFDMLRPVEMWFLAKPANYFHSQTAANTNHRSDKLEHNFPFQIYNQG